MAILDNLKPYLPFEVYGKEEYHPTTDMMTVNGLVLREWCDILDIKATVDYDFHGKRVGALYLNRFSSSLPTMVFGFELKGVHVWDLARTLPSYYDNWHKAHHSRNKNE